MEEKPFRKREVDFSFKSSSSPPSSPVFGRERRSSLTDGPFEKRETSIVKLNVGGYRYTTTVQTLTKITGSFFHILLEGKFAAPRDEEGYIFVDRDGRYFEPILNWLRTNELIIPDSMPREAVLREADFYCITPVVKQLQMQDTDSCGGKIFDSLICERKSSSIVQLATLENRLVALFEDGIIKCWYYEVTSAWSLEFSCDDLKRKGYNVQDAKVAFFSLILKTGRWFLAAFSAGSIMVWNKQGKFGEVAIQEVSIDNLFFVRKGQELVAINKEMGRITILSLASLNIRPITHAFPISCCCHDMDHISAYCASNSSIYQVMIGHNDNTCLQKLFSDPNKEEITVLRTKEQRTLYYGTDKGTIRRLEIVYNHGQATFMLQGHIHPIVDLAFPAPKTVVSLCSQDHIRSWSLEDIENCTSYSCSSGFLLEPLPYILQIKQEKADVVDIISGKLLLRLHSVNGSHIRTFCVCYDHLFLGGAVLVTGHGDGSIQIWSLGLLTELGKKYRAVPAEASKDPQQRISN